MFNCTRALALASLVFLAACGEKSGPADAPQNLTATAGDGQVVLHFAQRSGLTYWVFSAQGTGINRDNYLSFPEARVSTPINDGTAITGLTNGKIYSFFINATNGGSPAGPESITVAAKPRFAGVNWTANAPIGGGADAGGIAYGLTKYMTVARDGYAYTSTDARTWVATSKPGVGALNSVAFSGTSSLFIAVGDNGAIATSSDANAWTARTSNTPAKLNDVSSVGNSYVAVGDGGVIVGTSDYTNWVVRTSGISANLHKIKYIGGRFVVVGDNGTLVTSPDGFTWTRLNTGTSANLYDITYGNGVFLAVGANGAVLTSPDLATWTAQPALTANTLYGVTYGSQFIVVGQAGFVMYGTDGNTWSFANSAVSGDLYSVIYSLGVYLTVGKGGVNQYSS